MTRRAGALIALAAAGALLLATVPTLAVLRFTGFVAVALLAGRLLAPRQEESLALVIGLAAAAGLRILVLALGLPGYVDAVVLLVLAAGALLAGRARRAAPLSPALLLAIVAATGSIVWTQFGNGLEEGGAIAFHSKGTHEAWFHCSLAQQLRHHFPLEYPAGVTLGYHVLYNALAASVTDLTGASMFDVHYRLLPLVLAPALVLAAARFAGRMDVGAGGAVAGVAFLWFAEDLSWLPATLGLRGANVQSSDWNLLFLGPWLHGLHHNRGLLFGLAVSLGALTVAARALGSRESGPLWLAGLLVALAFEAKVFLGLTLAGGLAVVTVVAWGPHRRLRQSCSRGPGLLLVSGLLSVPVFLSLLAERRNESLPFELLPGYLGLFLLVTLGLVPSWGSIVTTVRGLPLPVAALVAALASLVQLAGSLGVRALGFVPLARSLRRDDATGILATATVGLGIAASLLLVTPPVDWNVLYFRVLPFGILAILAGGEALRLAGRYGPTGRVLIVGTLALLALPSTAQFLMSNRSFLAEPALRIPPGEVAAAGILRERSVPGDAILEPTITALTAQAPVIPVRPVPPTAAYFGASFVERRLEEVRAFYQDPPPGAARRLLRRHDVRWVWVPATYRESWRGPVEEMRVELSTADGTLYRVAAGPTQSSSR